MTDPAILCALALFGHCWRVMGLETGFRLSQFSNNEMLKNTDAVLEVILSAVAVDGPSPGAPLCGRHPLPQAGEGTTES